ncbi:MAG TPA: maltotransferase domain-containing protein, partial [Acetobacteraceae bacterium]|nr:maltotransferase domain-containing protein [Acetobacteraceae bacterium]
MTASSKAGATYYLNPLLAGPPDGWEAHFRRAARMGFEAVLLAPPFVPDEAGNLFRIRDHARLHPSLGGGDAFEALAMAARTARDAGLRLLLDLALSRSAADSALAAEHPDWFVAAGDGATMRFLGPDDVTVSWWTGMIGRFQDAGIAGFRCDGAHEVPPAVWRHVIGMARARDPEAMFICWALGAQPADLAGLAGCGFDYAASSSCYWDFRAGWLNEDADRITAIAPSIATPEPLFGARAATDADLARRAMASRRALALAAHYGSALLVPMGFEFGASEPMDPHYGDPREFADLAASPPLDLGRDIAAAITRRSRQAKFYQGEAARVVSPPWADIAVLLRGTAQRPGAVLLANASLDRPASRDRSTIITEIGGSGGQLQRFDQKQPVAEVEMVGLAPGEALLCRLAPLPPVKMAAPPRQAEAATAWPRIAIENVTPSVDGGRFPVKRIVGERVVVEADLLCDGHDNLSADLLWRAADEQGWQRAPMRLLNNDRWTASLPLERLGRAEVSIEAWKDVFASLADEITKKHAARVATLLETEEGIAMLRQAAARTEGDASAAFAKLLAAIDVGDANMKRELLIQEETVALMRATAERQFAVILSPSIPVDAERQAAGFASWYEIFPRSASNDEHRHGTFDDVIARLPAIRAMGFDVLYFPPIHPIGRKNRKGRNNVLHAEPDDPGSPYAIGSDEGGHDAINPALGTLEDFLRLRDAASENGLEIALDFAIQCAPDHPWLTQHPEWFDWRPDGSIKYAENPPKKYEDIVNVDFYAPGAKPALWRALRDVVLFWVRQGVRIFRVDNPHTKPFPFWEWMIGDIRGRYPDVMFLAEAFTRPKLMYRLAKIGFSQSYTYFTW